MNKKVSGLPRAARAALYLTILPLLLLSSCASLMDDMFISSKLGDKAKSSALTQEGIARYSADLAGKADFSKLGEVRKYFEVALRYDPDNAKARQYLDKIDSFRDATVRARLKEANRLLAKAKRSPDEDYALAVAVKTAYTLDPGSEDASKAWKDTAAVRSGLVKTFLERAAASEEKAKAVASDRDKEPLYADALAAAVRASAVDPGNGGAALRESSARSALKGLVAKRAESAHKLADSGKYDAAEDEVQRMASIDRRSGGAFTATVKAASLDLYYRWAKSLYDKKDYKKADQKVDVALASGRSPDALALKRKIAERDAEAVKSVPFETTLADIDRALARPDLVGAKRLVDAAARGSKDASRLDKLDDRRDRIAVLLKDYYEKGVAAYRAESFKSAIEFLSAVVVVDAEYEQAGDYLDKAREKQKLLDQFSAGS